MTPFGHRVRALRKARGMSQIDMAEHLKVSPAYLSALEHGRRGKPTFAMVQAIIGCLNIIWDEAEELQQLAEISDPRVVVDTAGLRPEATLLANRLAKLFHRLDADDIDAMAGILDRIDETTTSRSARLRRSSTRSYKM